MNMRFDVGCCVCECVLVIEKVVKMIVDLVVIVGKMNFYLFLLNVVFERVEFIFDVCFCL